jgi:serine protease Do
MSSDEHPDLPPAMRPQVVPYGTPISPQRGSRLSVVVLLVALLSALLVGPYLGEHFSYAINRGRMQAEKEAALEIMAQYPKDVSPVVWTAKIIEPSVVGIETMQVVDEEASDALWAPFFPQGRVGESLGSGVIIDSAGYILTNYHVVKSATKVNVHLADGNVISNAEVIGADPLSDLAVVKITANGLIAAKWGDSDKLQVGDQVVAVGSPFGLAETVTAGIVSAKNRHNLPVSEYVYQDFLQTDAAVNPGNSGGPLVNLLGQVVGINTAIVGHSYQGISFAIPSKMAQDVYERLRSEGKVVRGWLGVQSQDVTRPLAEKFGLKEAHGALVAGVLGDSPAEEAGIKQGDILLKWGDHPIASSTDLQVHVARSVPGSKVKVTLFRDGESREVTVTAGTRPSQFEMRKR